MFSEILSEAEYKDLVRTAPKEAGLDCVLTVKNPAQTFSTKNNEPGLQHRRDGISFTENASNFLSWNFDIMGHGSADHSRDPWYVAFTGQRGVVRLKKYRSIFWSPWVILNDLGAAFVMGAVGGGIWHSVKGAKNSPRVSHGSIQRVCP